MRKQLASAIGALLGLFSVGIAAAEVEGGSFAQKNFSSTATFTTDYVFRGVSNSNEEVAMQASFDYAHPVGIYVGVWGSNTDFSPGAHLELDYYGGFRNSIGGLGYDISALYYTFPGAEDDELLDVEVDYLEVHVGLSYTLPAVGVVEPSVGVGYNYSPDFYGEDGVGHYFSVSAAVLFPVGPLKFTVDGGYGYQDVEGDESTGSGGGMDGDDGFSYSHWQAGIKTQVIGFGLDLRYHETDKDAEDFFGDIADSRVVFTLSRSF